MVRGGYGMYYAQVFQNIPLFAQQQTNANFGVTPIKVGNRIIQFAVKYYF